MSSKSALFLFTLLGIACQSPSIDSELKEDNPQESNVAEHAAKEKDLTQNITTFQDDFPISREPVKLYAQQIDLTGGESFNLRIPQDWKISVAAQNMNRLRFMAKSPDGRLFATDMHNLTDNNKGKVYVFDGWNKESKSFDTTITYLNDLRNPNSIQFYTDEKGEHWLYLALTDKLVRYQYRPGDHQPHSEPEVLATFPDYGLSYKYGGWHLTRTIAIHNDQLYISVGSSCNVCEEKEDVRASIMVMNMDGTRQRSFAKGVRNAVGLKWVNGNLFSTNMGADHLGDDRPEEAMYVIEKNRHYGWPYYYQYGDSIYADSSFVWHQDTLQATDIPKAWSPLGSHTAPLGFEFFGGKNWPASVRNYFLVALHGSGKVKLGKGYEVVRAQKGVKPEPVITGFLQNGNRKGRPCDIFIWNERSFFLTDDHSGVLYYVEVAKA